ncbi:trace amine-associated receptor 6-like [Brachyhypopomus gauderio]|uniref:trace amine-associated receptor 6-like n=1 Tax=Brachyhypopomus gauderio TaxID=698409 RepID=UPI00404201CC
MCQDPVSGKCGQSAKELIRRGEGSLDEEGWYVPQSRTASWRSFSAASRSWCTRACRSRDAQIGSSSSCAKLVGLHTVLYCFPEDNSSCIKEVRTGTGNIFLFTLLSFISVCTVFLNLLVIISISHFKQLHTPTNLLILSLAVADLIVGLVVMPVNIMQLKDSCWYLGKMSCTVVLVFTFVSVSASMCNMVFIAGDRYIAVSDPLLYSTKVTVCKMSLLIILGWSCSLFYILMYMYFNNHLLQYQIMSRCHGECILIIKSSWATVDLVISFLCPSSVILVLYSIIFILARRQAKAFQKLKMTNDGLL